MKICYVVLFIFFSSIFCVQSQHDAWYYEREMIEEDILAAIITFEKYNPFVGSEHRRMCNGRPCTGNIIEKHPNGKILHKGFYTNGQLLNGYENFFDNGQLERKFRVLSPKRGRVDIYYSSGTIKSEIEYQNGNVRMWKDYYLNGNLKFWEEYDKSLEYYVTYNFYFINGNPQSTMTLIDRKNKIYDSAEYFSNGNIKAKGNRKWAPGFGGYVKIGTWTFSDIDGNVVQTKNFEVGAVSPDDEFFDDM